MWRQKPPPPPPPPSSSSSGTCPRASASCSVLCTPTCRRQGGDWTSEDHAPLFIVMSVLAVQVSSSSFLAGLRHRPVMPASGPGWSQLCGCVQINEDVLHGQCLTVVTDGFLIVPRCWWCALTNEYSGFGVTNLPVWCRDLGRDRIIIFIHQYMVDNKK